MALEVNVVGQPEIIHKSPVDAFVRITISDDDYIILSQYWPGKDDAGVVYLYDISNKSTSVIPMATSFSKAIAVNGTVYFKRGDGFYTYTPASGISTKLDIPVAWGNNGFVTDGVHFITMHGDNWPQGHEMVGAKGAKNY